MTDSPPTYQKEISRKLPIRGTKLKRPPFGPDDVGRQDTVSSYALPRLHRAATSFHAATLSTLNNMRGASASRPAVMSRQASRDIVSTPYSRILEEREDYGWPDTGAQRPGMLPSYGSFDGNNSRARGEPLVILKTVEFSRRSSFDLDYEANKDPLLVSWFPDEYCDSDNPANWSKTRKWSYTLLLLLIVIVESVTATIILPAIAYISSDTLSNGQGILVVSIYLFAYIFGSLVHIPLSEAFGRLVPFQSVAFIFLLSNTLCGSTHDASGLLIFRFISGFAASLCLSIGGIILNDCWRLNEGSLAQLLFSVTPLLSTAVGPIVGQFITQAGNWRWTFWSVSIAHSVLQVLAFIVLRETSARIILTRRTEELVAETGNLDLHTEWQTTNNSSLDRAKRAFWRPLTMLTTEPIVLVVALLRALLFGLLYSIILVLPRLWAIAYIQQSTTVALGYLFIVLGIILGAIIAYIILPRTSCLARTAEQTLKLQEGTALLLPLGTLLAMSGLILLARATQIVQRFPCASSGLFLFAIGAIMVLQWSQTYLKHSLPNFTTSTNAVMLGMSAWAGFAFSLTSTVPIDLWPVYTGYFFAGVVGVFGMVALATLWIFGKRWVMRGDNA